MKLAVVAIGRMKSGPDQELLLRYRDRAAASGKQLGLTRFDMIELPESRAATADARKREEAARLSGAIGADALTVCLDERGKDRTSQAFASEIAQHRDQGVGTLAFVLGGPDGLDSEFRKQNATLRFGQMTLPHQLARIVLMEQIYRATTILLGHPYHRQ